MKQYTLLISFVIVMIIALPLFWLKLMQWAFLDDKTIIAEGISIVGAILGGLISGALTLMGVLITIKNSKEKQMHESLPKKLLDVEDIIFILERQNEILLNNYGKNLSTGILNTFYNSRINYTLEYMENDGLLMKSANVSLKTYQVTRRLYNSLKTLQYNKTVSSIYPYEEINEAIATTISDLKIECQKLTVLIEK